MAESNSSEWPRMWEIFHAALERDGSARESLLNDACRGNDAMRQQVEGLLAAHMSATRFLEAPVLSVDSAAIAAAARMADGEGIAIPERVGDYRIRRVIGAGGMGIVYEAEQDHPRRAVALKVVRGGPYVDEHRLRLFQREIQSLARLKHPGIAAIYDAGRTPDGQHFFAMELIDGAPLNEYVSRSNASLRERLNLFCQICDAVSYAHQKGVIHRDLKPGNILVATNEPGKPASPRILDFGLARITDSDVAVTTLATAPACIVGTLQYMSPEQAAGRSDEIDVRSDVYALGVILYELLSGGLPYELGNASVPAALRLICEAPPRRLSSVNVRAARELRGDLETIVVKCLEKDAARRYPTAAALSDDVRRYLSDQPILARPPSTAYQFRKLVARHKAPSVLIGAILLLLIALTVTTSVQARRTARQRDIAVAEARRALAINAFVQSMLSTADPEEGAGPDTTVQTMLDEGARLIDTRFPNDARVAAGLHGVVGDAYSGLALYDAAEAHLRRALELMPPVEKEGAPAAQYRDSMATLLSRRGRSAEAETLCRQALAIDQRVLGPGHSQTAACLNNLATLLYKRGNLTEAQARYREALAIYEQLEGRDQPRVARILNNLAVVLKAGGDLDGAEPLLRRGLEINRKTLPEAHAATARTLNNLGEVLVTRGHYRDALPLLREAYEIRRRRLGDAHPDTAISLNNVAMTLGQTGDDQAAEKMYRDALNAARARLDDDHPTVLAIRSNLASVLTQRGRPDEAETLLRDILAAQVRRLPADHLDIARSRILLADALSAQQKWDRAKALYRKASNVVAGSPAHAWACFQGTARLERARGRTVEADAAYSQAIAERRKAVGTDKATLALSLNDLATLRHEAGRSAQAEPLLREAIAIRRARGDEIDLASALQNLGAVLRALGRLAEAKPLFEEALTIQRRRLPEDALDLARGCGALGWCLLDLSDHNAAVPLLRQALTIRETKLPADDWLRWSTMSTLGCALSRQNHFEQAERMLLESYEKLTRIRDTPAAQRCAAGTRIVELYEKWGKSEQATQWRARIASAAQANAAASQGTASSQTAAMSSRK